MVGCVVPDLTAEFQQRSNESLVDDGQSDPIGSPVGSGDLAEGVESSGALRNDVVDVGYPGKSLVEDETEESRVGVGFDCVVVELESWSIGVEVEVAVASEGERGAFGRSESKSPGVAPVEKSVQVLVESSFVGSEVDVLVPYRHIISEERGAAEEVVDRVVDVQVEEDGGENRSLRNAEVRVVGV